MTTKPTMPTKPTTGKGLAAPLAPLAPLDGEGSAFCNSTGKASKRAAIYARVSTADQADHGESLPSQLKSCRQYAAGQLGYEITAEIEEDVSGGTRFAERKKGRQLCDQIRRGEVDAVVFHAADRMSRYLPDAYMTVEDWLTRGVEIYALDLGRITDPNDIAFVIKGWQAGDEKRKIAERTMRGRRQAIEGGRVVATGPAKLGYRYEGKRKDTRLVIDQTEAETVKQIYTWFVYGDGDGIPMGVVAIVKKLNALGVPTRGGGRWLPGVVYSVLKAEIYTGTWRGFRYRDAPCKDGSLNKRTGKPKKTVRTRRPAEDWRAVQVPAIIDRGTWQKAKDRLAAGRYQGRATAHYEYLLSGRLVCSCGYHVQGKPCKSNGRPYLYYVCNGKDRLHTKGDCHLPNFRVSVWDEIVWNWVHGILMHPENLTKGMREEQKAREGENAHLLERLEQAKTKIAKCDAEIEKLGRMLYRDQCDDAFHDREKAIVERSRAEMAAERDEVQELLDGVTLTDEQIETIEEFAAEVREGGEVATFADKRRILGWLDFSGRATVEDGEQVIYARCKVMGKATRRLVEVSSAPTCS